MTATGMSRLGKTSTGMLRNAATPRITVSSAPTITACGLRNEKPGTVDDLVDQCWNKKTPADFIASIRSGVTRTYTLTGLDGRMYGLEQRVGRARAGRPELEMLENTENRDGRKCWQREEPGRFTREYCRLRNRRLCIEVHDLFYATGLRSCDESVTHDIVSNLGS